MNLYCINNLTMDIAIRSSYPNKFSSINIDDVSEKLFYVLYPDEKFNVKSFEYNSIRNSIYLYSLLPVGQKDKELLCKIIHTGFILNYRFFRDEKPWKKYPEMYDYIPIKGYWDLIQFENLNTRDKDKIYLIVEYLINIL